MKLSQKQSLFNRKNLRFCSRSRQIKNKVPDGKTLTLAGTLSDLKRTFDQCGYENGYFVSLLSHFKLFVFVFWGK